MSEAGRVRGADRGVTLLELIVAIALASVIAVAGARTALGHQRAFRDQLERLTLIWNVRAALSVLRYELLELGGGVGRSDLIRAERRSIEYEAARGVDLLCQSPNLGARSILVSWSGGPRFSRPEPGVHSLLVFAENDSAGLPHGRWLPGSIVSVRDERGCPGGAPGLRVVVAGMSVTALSRVLAGAPVRWRVRTRISVYRDATGDRWIGLQTRSAAGRWSRRQPVVGPVAEAGLQLTYFDGGGTPSVDPARIARVGATVIGQSSPPVRSVSGASMSATLAVTEQVALRNFQP